MKPSNTKQFDWSGHVESLEERLLMTADSVGGFLGGAVEQTSIDDSIPALEQHATLEHAEGQLVQHFSESKADFWINPDSQEALDQELDRIEQSLANAHDQSGMSAVRETFGLKGGGQTVAVIDSGIAYDHFALGGGLGENYRVVGGWDFTGEDDYDPYDDGGAGSHGTHVSGIIGASGGTHEGVAPDVDLVGLRVFDDAGNGYFSWVENALQWVHDNRDSFENPITTVNLSLGVASWNADTIPSWANLEDEFAQLEADGIFIAVSAGNSFTSFGEAGLSYPAASEYVIPVASVDDNGMLSYFSQRNQRVIAAPGRGIMSTVPDYAGNNNGTTDDYASFSGTSMASPYVAGASVIIREAMEFVGQTNITQDTIYDHMIATADTFYDSATDASYSRLNLESAISALMPTDDFGSTVASAHSLGSLGGASSMSGVISTLDDVDFFKFTAASTGTVTFTASNMTNDLDASWTVSGGTGTWSGENNEILTINVDAGQEYAVGLSSADGLGYYDLDVLAESSFSYTDWGSINSGEVGGISVSGETWFKVAANSDGYFTTEAFFDANGNQVTLELYNSNMELVDTGNAVGGAARVDHYASAGEEMFIKVIGTNSDVDFQLTNLVSVNGSTVTVAGTEGDDTFSFDAGNTHLVTVNGVEYSFDSMAVSEINFEGGAGSDTITLTGTTGDETATLRVGEATFEGVGFTTNALSIEDVTIHGGGGNDQATLYDSAGDDLFTATPTTASLVGSGFNHQVTNFDRVNAFATNGGHDEASLFDSASDDRFAGYATYAYMGGDSFLNYAAGFDRVNAFANSGGFDQASLFDSAGDDRFAGYATYAYMSGGNFLNYAAGFDRVYAFASNGGYDQASLFDSAGDDRFSGYATYAHMSGDNFLNYAAGFDRVYAFAGNGGHDEANLYDSAGDDRFSGYATYAYMSGDNFLNYAAGFDRVNAFANNGGHDEANLYDSAGDDRFSGYATYAYMSGDNFLNYAAGFDRVNAFANSGGFDQASLFDSAGDDRFAGYATYAYMSGDDFLNYAAGFDRVYAFASNGGYDQASLFDSAGDDHFYGYATHAYMSGDTFLNYAAGFDRVYAFASNGGHDEANLYDSAGNDLFVTSDNYSYLQGNGFLNYAAGFDSVQGIATAGGGDQAKFISPLAGDIAYGRGDYLTYTGLSSVRQSIGFDYVSLQMGSSNDVSSDVAATDYAFEQIGGV